MTTFIDRIFPTPLPTPTDIESRYPRRSLPDGAMVTRVGPSPTGFMHIGTLYTGLICVQLARQTQGVSILRIEDTDKKREVEGAVDFTIDGFETFGVEFDEGVGRGLVDRGDYGPYRQSERKEIYQAYGRRLCQDGQAYPCFAAAEELDAMRDQQHAAGARTGYYGHWAKWRTKSEEDVHKALDAGLPFVIRLKAAGKHTRKIRFDDLLFGHRTMPENDQDIVLLKSDGLPTYHMAHAVDDYLMGTTHVIRGDEWLPSVPLHLQLFEALGKQPPAYAHIAPINKMDGASRRKLSKRKDPEASVGFFEEQGYPSEAIADYLRTLADAGFEDWKSQNPELSSWDFKLSFKGLRGSSGPLFDFVKLGNISRNIIAALSSEDLVRRLLPWAKAHDADLAALMERDLDRVKAILSIERGVPNARKDIEKWSDVFAELSYFFGEFFDLTAADARAKLSYLTTEELAALVQDYLETLDLGDDRDAWFAKIKSLADRHGFALRPKDFKKNPEAYKGTVSDVAKVFRVLLTGKEQTPDLYSVMQVLGEDRVRDRIGLVV